MTADSVQINSSQINDNVAHAEDKILALVSYFFHTQLPRQLLKIHINIDEMLPTFVYGTLVQKRLLFCYFY